MFLFQRGKEEKAVKIEEIEIWTCRVKQQPLWVFVRTVV